MRVFTEAGQRLKPQLGRGSHQGQPLGKGGGCETCLMLAMTEPSGMGDQQMQASSWEATSPRREGGSWLFPPCVLPVSSSTLRTAEFRKLGTVRVTLQSHQGRLRITEKLQGGEGLPRRDDAERNQAPKEGAVPFV